MYYGDDKRRQMARSILPSVWRRGAAAEKAHIARAARRGVRAALRGLCVDPQAEDEAARRDLDRDQKARIEMGQLVSRRRGSDKLNHFMHWAERITKELPQDERLAAMRALLPRDLIGQHAIDHLRRHDAFVDPAAEIWQGRYRSRHLRMNRGSRRGVLVRILASPAARALLTEALLHGHRTTLWPTLRRCLQDPVEVLALEREGAWVPALPGCWAPVGPAQPPLPAPGDDLYRYLRLVDRAAVLPRFVPAPGLHVLLRRQVLQRQVGGGHTARWVTEPQRGLPNPAFHPEWRQRLDEVLRAFHEADGDLPQLQRLLREGRSG